MQNDDSSVLQGAGILWFFRFLTVGLGLAQIVAGRNTFGPDSRSYLELARAILRHDWPMTINAYWSALYPWLLAAVLGVVKPSLRWEFPVAHALAFPIYLVCMVAFEFFWRSLLQLRQLSTVRFDLTSPTIPATQTWALGYSLFIWLTIGDIILPINPDMCMTTFVLLAAGLFIRIAITAGAERSLFVWLGLCLGFGYLAKAILFPMAFVFLGMMIAVSARPLQKHGWGFALTFLIFICVVSPEIILLSHSKGRVTFSDTGKLAFVWYNYGLPLRDWQGEPAGSGTPVHPTHKIYEHPAIYEFNGPLRSSYPPWYDPSYWNEGLSPALKMGIVARHAIHEMFAFGLLFLHPTAWLVGVVLTLLWSNLKQTFKGIMVYWHLIAISGIAFSLYCLTLVQSRYLAPWLILLWGSVLAGVRLRRTNALFYRGVAAFVCVALVGAMVHLVYGESIHGFHNDARAEYVTAEGLKQIGLKAGDRVGAIGFDNDAHWAYLARLNIVAEINTDDTCFFWKQSPSDQRRVLEKFAEAGASVVVANTGGGIRTTSRAGPLDLAGCSRPGPGWRRIEGSPDQAFFLK